MQKMCPLRLVLIFLSAALAGLFVLRGLKARPEEPELAGQGAADGRTQLGEEESLYSKVRSAAKSGLWTCVDMASGRYLWRNLVASPPPSVAKKSS